MQVNHIDKNTIRVRINKEELAARGLKVLDLLGNKEKIQHFFYSILAEVDTDHTFSQGTPVSFQIMPNNSGLDLLISKVKSAKNTEANSLDQMLHTNGDNYQSFEADNDVRRSYFDLNPEDDAKTEVNPALVAGRDIFPTAQAQNDYWKFQTQHNYQFKDLGEVVALAQNLQVEDLASSLYFYKENYFLKLVFLDENYVELAPADAWAIANEYGIKVNEQQMKIVVDEGKCLLARDALGNLRQYFSKNNK